MVAVAFSYAPLAPLVSVFAAVAFFASSMIYKYQLLFVSVTEVESGGRMWKPAINRMLVCLVFQQGRTQQREVSTLELTTSNVCIAILVLTIGLQQGWIRSIACVPPVGLIIVYKIVLHRQFDERYNWYMPTDQEVVNAVIHRADARKNRLHKRFGNPALHAELFTPMIHKRSQHLLRQIYSGRMAEEDYIRQYDDEAAKSGLRAATIPGSEAETGGLAFKAIEEEDLEQSREAYLREQDAWETGSLSTAANGDSTPLYRGDAAQGYFEAKKRQYLANGLTPQPGTPDVYEMARVPSETGRPGESQEDLLYGIGTRSRQGAGGGYGQPVPSTLGHYPGPYVSAGTGSFENVGLTYGPNGSEYFEEPAYPVQQAPRYQHVPDLPSAAAAYHTAAPFYRYPPQQQGSPPQQFSTRHPSQPSRGSGQDFYGHASQYSL